MVCVCVCVGNVCVVPLLPHCCHITTLTPIQKSQWGGEEWKKTWLTITIGGKKEYLWRGVFFWLVPATLWFPLYKKMVQTTKKIWEIASREIKKSLFLCVRDDFIILSSFLVMTWQKRAEEKILFLCPPLPLHHPPTKKKSWEHFLVKKENCITPSSSPFFHVVEWWDAKEEGEEFQVVFWGGGEKMGEKIRMW